MEDYKITIETRVDGFIWDNVSHRITVVSADNAEQAVKLVRSKLAEKRVTFGRSDNIVDVEVVR